MRHSHARLMLLSLVHWQWSCLMMSSSTSEYTLWATLQTCTLQGIESCAPLTFNPLDPYHFIEVHLCLIARENMVQLRFLWMFHPIQLHLMIRENGCLSCLFSPEDGHFFGHPPTGHPASLGPTMATVVHLTGRLLSLQWQLALPSLPTSVIH